MRSPTSFGRLALAGATVDSRARTWPRQAARLLGDLVLGRPDLLPVLADDYRRCGVRRFDHMLADLVEDTVAQLRGPVVLVRGQWDPLSPRAWNRLLADRAPGARLSEVPRAGHDLCWTRAAGLAQVLREVVSDAGDAVRPSG